MGWAPSLIHIFAVGSVFVCVCDSFMFRLERTKYAQHNLIKMFTVSQILSLYEEERRMEIKRFKSGMAPLTYAVI